MIKRLFQRKKSSLISTQYKLFLKESLGIAPRDEKWYLQAITHRSKKKSEENKGDNERLEFLGDALISLVVADYLFSKFPDKDEGYLTQLRAKIVSRNYLNKLAKKLQLDEFIIYQKTKNTYKSLLGNCLEALFGAIMIDQGYEKAKQIFTVKILEKLVDLNQVKAENRDFKSELFMLFQKQNKTVNIDIKENQTTNNAKKFVAVVFMDEKELGIGFGNAKKEAEQEACKNSLTLL